MSYIISSGDLESGIILENDTMTVLDGGVATETTVNTGGFLEVSSGGGDDVFAFCENWGADTVEQLATGTVTLWFASGELTNWDEATLTYTDGENKVTVKGVTAEQVTLKFGDDGTDRYDELLSAGAFSEFTSRKIFEENPAQLA